jgi:hypothetical protein
MLFIPPPVQLMQMLFGFSASRAICVSAELCIANLLKDGAKINKIIAEQTGVHARSLYLVLRATMMLMDFFRIKFTVFTCQFCAMLNEYQPPTRQSGYFIC